MGLGFLILVPLPLMFNFFLIISANSEGDALSALKSSLSDPNGVLRSWDATLVNPCSWSIQITCDNDSSVTRIDLGNKGLSGELVSQLGSLPNLQYLELYSNNISGEIPPELGNLANLVSLDLYRNNLSGPIPDELGKLQRLRFLRLNNNSLSGTIPMSLTSINALEVLDLAFNNLSGIIPNNGSFAIFDRIVPNNDSFLSPFAGNPYLKTAPSQSSRSSSHFREISLVAAGVGAILLLSALAVAFVQHRRRKHRVLVPATEDSETHLGQLKRFFLRELRAATNNFHQRRKHRVQFFDLQAKEDSETHLGQLKRFPLRELRAATNNFHHKNFIGRGTFGEVYKGCMADGSLVAVKRLKDECTRGEELLFQTELQMISMAVHRNLLRLRGFCMTATERFLVYPLMANGSVASCLRACQGLQPQLDWLKRKQIALGSAKGLAYLHHQCAPKIIHLGIKAASILLNEEFEAVVGDFGLAKSMGYSDTHVTTAVRGATGYIAPEYYCSGKCSEKTDVYGYGVMLLELITGQQALDLSRLARDNAVMLDDWVKGHLEDKKLARLVDANLQGNYIQEEAEQLIQVALLCIQSIPMQRPTMLQVLKMLEGDGLAERWQEWQNQEVVYRESNHALFHNGSQIFDSTSKLRPDELSCPR